MARVDTFSVLPGFALGFAGDFLLVFMKVHALQIRLSRSIKRIRVSVAVKGATKSAFTCALRALSTLPRTLKRALRRHPYSDTLNRTAYAIPSRYRSCPLLQQTIPC